MKNRLLSALLALALLVPVPARAAEDPFVAQAKQAVGILYSQTEQGGMVMHCTVTAFDKQAPLPTPTKDGSVPPVVKTYSFLSAAHCVGEDRKDAGKELSASPENIPFYITFDEQKGDKRFWPANVKWVGYQSRGEDFAVFEVKSTEDWPTIPIGNSSKLKDGAAYWNIASPLGLGRQVQEGVIASTDLDRPIIFQDINWRHTLVLQQTGVNGGSSGSALIEKSSKTIVGTLVGSIAGSTIIAIPIDRFTAVKKAVEAGKYKYWKQEVNIGPDGEPVGDK